MIQLPIFQIDAFTNMLFRGNPAAICPLPVMLSTEILQSVAAENNLSETAFLLELQEDDETHFLLRWFTPTIEVDLCGHATLAAAHVVFTHMKPDLSQVKFSTRSGVLTVDRTEDRYCMSFPNLNPVEIEIPEDLGAAMGAEPVKVYKSDHADRDLLLVYENAEAVRRLEPSSEALKAYAPFGFIATARGEGDADFVSRCFFPNHGIVEDPVTGSAHCVSGPYWARELGKAELYAKQLSMRGGELWLKICPEHIEISGQATEFLQGVYLVPE